MVIVVGSCMEVSLRDPPHSIGIGNRMLEDRHLGPSWEHLGAFLAISCDFGALLEHFWGHLGPFWALLGAFLGQLGAILGYLRPSWAILGPSWEQELFRNPRPNLPVPRPHFF